MNLSRKMGMEIETKWKISSIHKNRILIEFFCYRFPFLRFETFCSEHSWNRVVMEVESWMRLYETGFYLNSFCNLLKGHLWNLLLLNEIEEIFIHISCEIPLYFIYSIFSSFIHVLYKITYKNISCKTICSKNRNNF